MRRSYDGKTSGAGILDIFTTIEIETILPDLALGTNPLGDKECS